MKQNAKQLLFLSILVILVILPVRTLELHQHKIEAAKNEPKKLAQILDKRKNHLEGSHSRNSKKLVNILIVPGHDNENSGTEFDGVKEVDLNRMLAKKLYEYLSKEDGINVVLTSTEQGYQSIFENYFKNDRDKIIDFINISKQKFLEEIDSDDLELVNTNFHNVAPSDVAERLYGINRWANKQDFDLVIHIHFNDHRGRKKNKIGEYEGFAIYTPGRLFENYKLSRSLADSIFMELKKVQVVSNLENEKEGVVENHELIALGANESLDAGAVLVEYGYIYEDNFINIEKREITLDYFAYATYSGIKKMMKEQPASKESRPTLITQNKTTKDNLMWQFQKALEGTYPSEGKDLRDCPVNGYFGKCSEEVKI